MFKKTVRCKKKCCPVVSDEGDGYKVTDVDQPGHVIKFSAEQLRNLLTDPDIRREVGLDPDPQDYAAPK